MNKEDTLKTRLNQCSRCHHIYDIDLIKMKIAYTFKKDKSEITSDDARIIRLLKFLPYGWVKKQSFRKMRKW